MKTLNIKHEWEFVRKEITSSNKGGTKRGSMLFNFQILLYSIAGVKNAIEKQILTSFYQKHKKQYLKL